MSLLFKHGALSTQQQDWAKGGIDKYPYSALLKHVLPYEWCKANLLDHDIHETSWDGRDYIRKSQMYMTFSCPAGVLYFFLDKRDHAAVVTVTENVIDVNPFMTIIG